VANRIRNLSGQLGEREFRIQSQLESIDYRVVLELKFLRRPMDAIVILGTSFTKRPPPPPANERKASAAQNPTFR